VTAPIRRSAARDRLLAAAAETLSARGYLATGVSDVLSTARVPSGVLYHHFGSKEALAEAAVGQIGAQVLSLFDEALVRSGSVLGGLLEVVDHWEAVLRDSGYAVGCPIATTALETSSTDGPLQRACAQAYDSWLQRLTRALVDERVPPQEARQRAVACLAVIEGALLLSRAMRSLESVRAVRPALAALLGTGAGDRT
jgi:TetR/AcrR family transcriptional repressor of lmrAB and yxaGH operons